MCVYFVKTAQKVLVVVIKLQNSTENAILYQKKSAQLLQVLTSYMEEMLETFPRLPACGV
jgi:hypothetical protein